MPNDQDTIRSTGKSDRQVEADLQKAEAEELDVDPLNWWFWIVLAGDRSRHRGGFRLTPGRDCA